MSPDLRKEVVESSESYNEILESEFNLSLIKYMNITQVLEDPNADVLANFCFIVAILTDDMNEHFQFRHYDEMYETGKCPIFEVKDEKYKEAITALKGAGEDSDEEEESPQKFKKVGTYYKKELYDCLKNAWRNNNYVKVKVPHKLIQEFGNLD